MVAVVQAAHVRHRHDLARCSRLDVWVANYYSARNPLRLSSLVSPGSGR